jgi:hypothetical protein
MTLYKVLNEHGAPNNGGKGTWPLPTDEGPGDWIEVAGPLVPCRTGLHLCDGELQLLTWLGPRIFVAEHSGERINHQGDKIVVRRARLLHETAWDARTARLFAADCAENVLPIFERERPDDDRPREAIEAARAFARGEMDRQGLAAARDAARAAAWAAEDAAWAAAWAAEDAARDAEDAAWAAEDAAWAAARDAAWTAARAAAWTAAWTAARDAEDAAWAAEDAAWAAARDAAWTAARDAARAAECQWQAERLSQYLTGALGGVNG